MNDISRTLFVTKPSSTTRNKWKARWMEVARDVAETKHVETDKNVESLPSQPRDMPWHHVLAPAIQLPSRHVDPAPKVPPERHIIAADAWWKAVESGDYVTVEHALDSSLRWNHYTTTHQRTALHTAAMHSQVACLTSLLSHDASVNATDKLKRTALHYACEVGALACVKLLLSHGAQVDVRDKAYDTPLHCAARNHRTSIVKYLCDTQRHELRVNAKNKRRETPLLTAVKYAAPRDTIVILLANGATPTVTDVDDYDSFTYAARNHPALLEALLSSNQPNSNDLRPRRSALAEALLYNSAACVHLLLTHRQHMALEITSSGMTAVAMAAACCATTALIELVHHNGEKSLLTEDINGISPLIHAILAVSMKFDTLYTIIDLNPDTCLYQNRRYEESIMECLLRVAKGRTNLKWVFAVPWIMRHGSVMTASAMRFIAPTKYTSVIEAPALRTFGEGDVALVCDGGTVRCHRWLLILYSDYFKSLFNFQSTMEVKMEGVDVSLFQTCVSWMCGEYDVFCSCSADELCDLLFLCNEYLLERMQLACEAELCKRYDRHELSSAPLVELCDALQLHVLSRVLSSRLPFAEFSLSRFDVLPLVRADTEENMNFVYYTLRCMRLCVSLETEYVWLLVLLLTIRSGTQCREQVHLLKRLIQSECIDRSFSCTSFLRSCYTVRGNSEQLLPLQLLVATHFIDISAIYVAVMQFKPVHTLCPQHVMSLLERGHLMNNGDGCDIVFQCDGAEYRLHRGVIIQSEKLAGLMRFHDNSQEPIQMDIDDISFRDIVCFMYCGFVMHHDGADVTQQLLNDLYAADEYLIEGMILYIESMLATCVNEHSCASIYHTARCLHLDQLACIAGKEFLMHYHLLAGDELRVLLSNTDVDMATWSGEPPTIPAAIAEYDEYIYGDSFCADVLMHVISFERNHKFKNCI